MSLMYFRLYITLTLLGYLFGLDTSNVSREVNGRMLGVLPQVLPVPARDEPLSLDLAALAASSSSSSSSSSSRHGNSGSGGGNLSRSYANAVGSQVEPQSLNEPSPMSGIQQSKEVKLSFTGLNQMDDDDEINDATTDPLLQSPGLFIDESGFGEKLILSKRGGSVKLDLDAIRKHFPKFGHASFMNWETKRGICLRFSSFDNLKEAYSYCIVKTCVLAINFCMQRGKPCFGGVPASEHPGKIVVRHAYASSISDVRGAIRTILINIFKPHRELSHDSNRFFERWIDARPANSNWSTDRQSKKRFQEFTVFIYLTETRFVEPVVDALDDQYLSNGIHAPKPMRLSG